jgi:hypothetical protein
MEAKHWTTLTVYYIVLQCDNTQHSMGPHDVVIAIAIASANAIAITISIAIPLQSRQRRQQCCKDKPAEVEARRNRPSGRRCKAPLVPTIEGAGGRAGDEAGGEAQRGCVA